MNHSQTRYLLTLAAVFIFALGFGLAWLLFVWIPPQTMSSSAANSARVVIPMGIAFLVLIGSGFALYRSFNTYLFTIKNLAEGLTLIVTANATHRVEAKGPPEIQQLVRTINTFGEQYQELRMSEKEKIRQAREDLALERNRLAALISELTEGILVCNVEGRILLYNQRAKDLLSQSTGFVGLGRSVFGLIDRNAIMYAYGRLVYQLEQGNEFSAPHFLTAVGEKQFLRVRIVPVLDTHTDNETKPVAEQITAFILTLEDITLQFVNSAGQDVLLRNLGENVRAAIGNIRAAIEMMRQFPDMDSHKLAQFRTIIHDESHELTRKLNHTLAEHDQLFKTQWELQNMQASDLLTAIQWQIEERLKLSVIVEADSTPDLWVRVGGYAVVQAATFIIYHLKTDLAIDTVSLTVKRSGRFANFIITWQEEGVERNTLPDWRHESLLVEGEGIPFTFDEVIEWHGGEAWFHPLPGPTSQFRLLLPISQATAATHQRSKSNSNGTSPVLATSEIRGASRPEYYEFDLFGQMEQSTALDQRLLTELVYTVLDTETTGLTPGQDEIISIGAARMVRGRLLSQEVFDQLVDPQRPMAQASIDIHGIQPELLVGQPTIEVVLPKFHRFVEETVLVGHNLAFDMRMFQEKEAKTGLTLTNPILDTLLLSAVIHPNQADHSIEAIAQRVGVNVMGRHTALGDAIVTGEIFLKFIPLLAEQGITTLEQARQASAKTYYARLQY